MAAAISVCQTPPLAEAIGKDVRYCDRMIRRYCDIFGTNNQRNVLAWVNKYNQDLATERVLDSISDLGHDMAERHRHNDENVAQNGEGIEQNGQAIAEVNNNIADVQKQLADMKELLRGMSTPHRNSALETVDTAKRNNIKSALADGVNRQLQM